MQISIVWAGKGLRGLVALCLGVFASTLAYADNYNILLKPPSGTSSCAGGFTFTKTGVGSFATTSPSVVLTTAGCPDITKNNVTLNTVGSPAFNVIVEQVTLNNQDQGPNVVGLTGKLSGTVTTGFNCPGTNPGNSSKTYEITFAYTSSAPSPNPAGRTYTLTCLGTGQGNNSSVSGLYHVVNATNTVPEPGSLWIVTLGLGLLVASRRFLVRR